LILRGGLDGVASVWYASPIGIPTGWELWPNRNTFRRRDEPIPAATRLVLRDGVSSIIDQQRRRSRRSINDSNDSGVARHRLPGKDGLTLTREIRAHSDIGIILTGKQGRSTASWASKAAPRLQ
jgi:hypothetical protein